MTETFFARSGGYVTKTVPTINCSFLLDIFIYLETMFNNYKWSVDVDTWDGKGCVKIDTTIPTKIFNYVDKTTNKLTLKGVKDGDNNTWIKLYFENNKPVLIESCIKMTGEVSDITDHIKINNLKNYLKDNTKTHKPYYICNGIKLFIMTVMLPFIVGFMFTINPLCGFISIVVLGVTFASLVEWTVYYNPCSSLHFSQ